MTQIDDIFRTVPDTGKYYTAPGEAIFPLSDPLTALSLVEDGLVVPSTELIMASYATPDDKADLALYSEASDRGLTDLTYGEAMTEHTKAEKFREAMILTAINDFIEAGYTEGNLLEGMREAIKSMESIHRLIQYSKRVTLHGASSDMQTFHAFIAFLVGEKAHILSGLELRHGVLSSGRGYAGELHFTARLGSTQETVCGVFNPSRLRKPTLMHEVVAVAKAMSNDEVLYQHDTAIVVELRADGTYQIDRAHSQEALMDDFLHAADDWYTVNLLDVQP